MCEILREVFFAELRGPRPIPNLINGLFVDVAQLDLPLVIHATDDRLPFPA